MKKIILVVLFAICGLGAMQAQTAVKDSTFQKHWLITADVAGGFRIWYATPGGRGGVLDVGIGTQYNFHKYLGFAAGLRYELHAFWNHFTANYLYFPLEIDAHWGYFYFRFGFLMGVGLKAQVAANSKDVLFLGGTLGIGGRVPITKKDNLSFGMHFIAGRSLDRMDGHERLVLHFAQFSPVLKIGYEHRF